MFRVRSPQVDAVEKIARQVFDTILEESTHETMAVGQIFDITSEEPTRQTMIARQIFATKLEESAQETMLVGQIFDTISEEPKSTEETSTVVFDIMKAINCFCTMIELYPIERKMHNFIDSQCVLD